jgi:hypothetical protein
MAYNCPPENENCYDYLIYDTDRASVSISYIKNQTEARPRYTADMIPADIFLEDGDARSEIPDFFNFSMGVWGCTTQARDLIVKITDDIEFHPIN